MSFGKNLLAGLVVLLLLSVVSLPIFSQTETVVLTLSEYNAINSALETAQSELKKAKSSIQLLKDTQSQQGIALTALSTVWPMLKQSSNEQETALKSEYWRGYLDGALTGLSIGFVAGETTGLYIGFKFSVP